jgi:NADH-quinone oxidoreductase subunit N
VNIAHQVLAQPVLAHPAVTERVLAVDNFVTPHLNYKALMPILILLGAAIAGVLVEAFVPRRWRQAAQLGLGLAALVVAFIFVILNANGFSATNRGTVTADGAVAVDGPALFLQGTLILLGAVSLLFIAERTVEPGGAFVASAAVTAGTEMDRLQARREPGNTDVYPLAIFSLGGMLLFVSANDLLTMFVALEVFSLPLYLLCALARRRRLLSQEAAMKYFLLGAFSSAFFLFGIALIYGFAGVVSFGGIHDASLTSNNSPALLFGGFALVAIGLLFKTAAVPFHVWTPDVYQGAPTPVTGFMAACTKTAAFGALLRVAYVAFGGVSWDYKIVIGVIAALTMLVGSILAVTQTDIKRLLAYSSIANAGYVLVGLLALNRDGLSSTMFYLVAYGFTIIAAFGVVTMVRDADGEATHLSRWAGLGKRSPLYAAVFTFLMLAFAGIPLTSGFTAKFAVFAAAIGGGQTWLVIFGVVTSMILAFPYLRVVVLMYLSDPGEQTPTISIPGALTSAALAIGVLATLVLGLVPTPVLDLANRAAEFVR